MLHTQNCANTNGQLQPTCHKNLVQQRLQRVGCCCCSGLVGHKALQRKQPRPWRSMRHEACAEQQGPAHDRCISSPPAEGWTDGPPAAQAPPATPGHGRTAGARRCRSGRNTCMGVHTKHAPRGCLGRGPERIKTALHAFEAPHPNHAPPRAHQTHVQPTKAHRAPPGRAAMWQTVASAHGEWSMRTVRSVHL